MRLLFDQNLSPHLVAMLADLFPGSKHVQSLGLDRAPDVLLWDFAREHNYVIVTRDVEFSEQSVIAGHPPKVIWIRLGNCTTLEIESAIRRNRGQIGTFGESKDLGVLTLLG